MARIRLSDAQISALECREEALDSPLDTAWQGGFLVFTEFERETLFAALCDASNAEDAGADPRNESSAEMRAFARRAAASLSALSGRVLR